MAQAVPASTPDRETLPEPTAVPVRKPSSPSRGAGAGRLVLGSALLLALAAGTYWNATRSPALSRAVAAESKSQFADALQAALEHLDSRPWSRDAARIAARCLSRLDFVDQAEPYYRKAGALTPEDRHYRAYGLVRSNRREPAVAAYREILELDPTDATALKFLGGVYLSQARWAELKGVAERLVELPDRPTDIYSPTTTQGHWTFIRDRMVSPTVVGRTLQALAFHDDGQIEESVGSFEAVLRLDPDLKLTPLNRTLFWAHYTDDLLKVGRAADVISKLQRFPEADRDIGLLDILARAYLQLGRLDEAETTWSRILALSPKNTSALLNLGRLDLQRNRPEPASKHLARAAALAPDSYEVAYSLSQAYRQLGKADESRKFQQKAAAIQSKNAGTNPIGPQPK